MLLRTERGGSGSTSTDGAERTFRRQDAEEETLLRKLWKTSKGTLDSDKDQRAGRDTCKGADKDAKDDQRLGRRVATCRTKHKTGRDTLGERCGSTHPYGIVQKVFPANRCRKTLRKMASELWLGCLNVVGQMLVRLSLECQRT